ncbi:MAG: hypothetical protein ACLRWP_01810 [Bilophila wadsworthia]
MTEQEKVVQIGVPDERERRRRRYELLAAFLLLLLVLGGTWTQLTLYGVDSWMFIALLNINSIFMLIILFLVARNVVKLIMERRRKVFGAQIRTRLVVVFVSLSLIPTVIMFLASNRVVATSVDYWFTRRRHPPAALDVGQSFMRQRRNVCTAVPRRSLRKPHNGASLGRPPAPTRFFKQSKKNTALPW